MLFSDFEQILSTRVAQIRADIWRQELQITLIPYTATEKIFFKEFSVKLT